VLPDGTYLSLVMDSTMPRYRGAIRVRRIATDSETINQARPP
jgi:hypothetical protein